METKDTWHVCPDLWICQSSPNPFELYILPLAHEHRGLLDAVLGLTACHISKPGVLPRHYLFNAAIEYRLKAIQSLSALLAKEDRFGLSALEEEIALAIVLMLVFHDVSVDRMPSLLWVDHL